ncbi:putative bifunctional diguanylate cyclase/phosphodiesterase [Blastopirellula marina]|uniref:GGDEF-domain containing protein n=1 Tax=Blastopirellula marina TaxID=124 RepID=A0A2S8GQA7_9BACT|nr:EAL domain-containing protein [Blastopirellula marina]PQO46613.1 hypothetical protein C5Y93_09095 [Blastopirellula marina]
MIDSQPTENPPSEKPGHSRAVSTLHRKVWIDILVLGGISIFLFYIFSFLDVFEMLAEINRRHEDWEVDEALISLTLVTVMGLVFIIRRYREVLTMVRERGRMVSELIAAHETIMEDKLRLRNAAYSDFLTGLPNRAWLLKHLERAAPSQSMTLIFFDIDRFKQVNDLHGHTIGDELIREVARRSTQVLQIEGGLAPLDSNRAAVRLAGDEFVIVVRDLEDRQEVRELAQRLQDSLSSPYSLMGANVSATASIGVATESANGEGREHLLADADAAMYQAKLEGRGRIRHFQPSMRERLTRRARLGVDLQGAIRSHQLHLNYHPILSLDSGHLEGAESLVRWNHPVLGGISPAEFIPIAEESDTIFDLGAWVLEESLRQMSHWIQACKDLAPDVISVNVSRKQFSDPQMIENFARIIRESNVPPARIQLEITEDVGDIDLDLVVTRMHQLKQLGVKIAIDDFGTGTSTFAAIKSFPIDTVKLDISLVSQIVSSIDRAAIVHSLAILVRNLNVKMVAEGVETAQQIPVLQELGCHSAQGFYFSKPLDAKDFETQMGLFGTHGFTVEGFESFPSRWKEKLIAFKELNAT